MEPPRAIPLRAELLIQALEAEGLSPEEIARLARISPGRVMWWRNAAGCGNEGLDALRLAALYQQVCGQPASPTTGDSVATEIAGRVSGEQLRMIDRYVVPLLVDALPTRCMTAVEVAAAGARMRRLVIEMVAVESSRAASSAMASSSEKKAA